MDAHFWKKHKENSPNLLYVLEKHAFWTVSFQCLAKSLVSTTCAVVIFRVKVSCITSVDGIKL